MLIYKSTNTINNKMYIGQTIQTLKERIYGHKSKLKAGSRLCFHNAIRKYGINNFDWEIIYECNDSNKLDKMEMYYIGYYDTYNNGYNSTLGGDKGTVGYKHTKESLQKISDAQTGYKHHGARPVSVEGKSFATIKEAAIALNVCWNTVWNRLRKSNNDYYYLDEGGPDYVCTR